MSFLFLLVLVVSIIGFVSILFHYSQQFWDSVLSVCLGTVCITVLLGSGPFSSCIGECQTSCPSWCTCSGRPRRLIMCRLFVLVKVIQDPIRRHSKNDLIQRMFLDSGFQITAQYRLARRSLVWALKIDIPEVWGRLHSRIVFWNSQSDRKTAHRLVVNGIFLSCYRLL